MKFEQEMAIVIKQREIAYECHKKDVLRTIREEKEISKQAKYCVRCASHTCDHVKSNFNIPGFAALLMQYRSVCK